MGKIGMQIALLVVMTPGVKAFLSFDGFEGFNAFETNVIGSINCRWPDGMVSIKNVTLLMMDEDGMFFKDTLMATSRSDGKGSFNICGLGGDLGILRPDPYIKVLFNDPERLALVDEGQGTPMAIMYRDTTESNAPRYYEKTVQMFGDTSACPVFYYFQEALAEYRALAQREHPAGNITVESGCWVQTKSVKATSTTTNTIYLCGFAPSTLFDAKYLLGHTIIQSYTGWMYPRHHKIPGSGFHEKTDITTAFYDGWAAYWAGFYTISPVATDYEVSGNVVYALHTLSTQNCPGVRLTGKEKMVYFLKRYGDGIHNYESFEELILNACAPVVAKVLA